jgi:hypothetical protein
MHNIVLDSILTIDDIQDMLDELPQRQVQEFFYYIWAQEKLLQDPDSHWLHECLNYQKDADIVALPYGCFEAQFVDIETAKLLVLYKYIRLDNGYNVFIDHLDAFADN